MRIDELEEKRNQICSELDKMHEELNNLNEELIADDDVSLQEEEEQVFAKLDKIKAKQEQLTEIHNKIDKEIRKQFE